MKRKHVVAAAVTVVVAAGGGGVAYAASSSPDITSAQTLRLVAHQSAVTFVPVPGQTRQVQNGDEILFTEQLSHHGSAAGTDQIGCTVVGRGLICDGVFALHDGDLTVTGKVPVNGPGHGATLAVTGGTGLYRNVRGQVTVMSTGRSTEVETFQLLP